LNIAVLTYTVQFMEGSWGLNLTISSPQQPDSVWIFSWIMQSPLVLLISTLKSGKTQGG
jgi:hypothetical protein